MLGAISIIQGMLWIFMLSKTSFGFLCPPTHARSARTEKSPSHEAQASGEGKR